MLQRAEELKCLIKGNEAMRMAQGRLQLVEISSSSTNHKRKKEMQAQQMKMKAEIAKQINVIACFPEAFKTHVCMTKTKDGRRIVDQQQLKLFEQSFQLTDEINDGKNDEKIFKK